MPETSLPLDALRATATDMTLLLGAQSHITSHRDNPDPRGEQCLADFIDLVLNCESMYVTLPKTTTGDPGLLQTDLRAMLKDYPNAAMSLKPEAEQSVFMGFKQLVNDSGLVWVNAWIRFQLLNPIVTAGHAERLGAGGELISPNGLEQWRLHHADVEAWLRKRRGGHVLRTEQIRDAELRIYWEGKHREGVFASVDDFALCYAFDVYRRGWQYLQSVGLANPNAAYFPHALRYSALKNGNAVWDMLESAREVYWSWGKCITLLMQQDRDFPRTPQKVAEIMGKLRDQIGASSETGKVCPQWVKVAEYDDGGNLRLLPPAEAKELTRTVEEMARKAGLRMSRRQEETPFQRIVKRTMLGGGKQLLNQVGNGLFARFRHTPPMPWPIAVGVAATSAMVQAVRPDLVYQAETVATNALARTINHFRKGTFVFPGLFPGDAASLPERSADPAER